MTWSGQEGQPEDKGKRIIYISCLFSLTTNHLTDSCSLRFRIISENRYHDNRITLVIVKTWWPPSHASGQFILEALRWKHHEINVFMGNLISRQIFCTWGSNVQNFHQENTLWLSLQCRWKDRALYETSTPRAALQTTSAKENLLVSSSSISGATVISK